MYILKLAKLWLLVYTSVISAMDEINYSNSIISTNNQNNINGTTSIKQNVNGSGFKAFQSKVASESLCRREVGVIIGVFGGAGAAVGGIFAIKVGVAAMVGALAGLVGTAAAPFVLIGMGALCIAAIIGGVVLSVKNRKENIYIKELNKLLQSDDVANRKQAISYLNEMISEYEEGSAEHNAAVRSLNKNTKIFEFCLISEDSKLVDETIKFLTKVSKDKFKETERAIRPIITYCLNLKNNVSRGNATKLLTEMLKDKDIQTFAETIIMYKFLPIKNYLVSKDDQLRANTIALLKEMLKSENTNLASIAKKIITDSTDKKVVTEVQGLADIIGFADIIKSCIGSGNDELKANTNALLEEMFNSENKNLASIAEKIRKNYL